MWVAGRDGRKKRPDDSPIGAGPHSARLLRHNNERKNRRQPVESAWRAISSLHKAHFPPTFPGSSVNVPFFDRIIFTNIYGLSQSSPRGLFVSTTIVVAFNPDFLTKNDRVFKVQCFYMEMVRRLQKEIEIMMPQPTMHAKQLPMPVCKYEVLDGSPTGPPVYFATVGQMVYHKWTCETEHENTFCMLVHSCFVDDGNGQRVQLLNEKGCALDKYLLTNLEYPTDLMAGREAHVYKYADRDNMYFDCQISVTVKEPGLDYCDVPSCPDPPRRRRSTDYENVEYDLHYNITETEEDGVSRNYIIPNDDIIYLNWLQRNFDMRNAMMCMTGAGATLLAFLNASLFIVSFAGIIFACCSRSSKKTQY
ncbi:unnamed protein product [Caenorhabditis auriculariae]|uniref:ZP domain-containing protein n=1 Tax=Caenorhabditis auriculariae TaxID=2777116 RepID=A0A8S1GXX1_9PELO|nr:unnamed protein product [Caenorhabditis auriculariae]